MKKLAIGLFLILGLSVFAEGNKIEVRGGYDFGAKYDVDDIWDGGDAKPYLKADLGYSFNTNKANNGMYYGAGVGVSYNNFNVDLMYKENKSKINGWLWDSSLNYKRITLGFGYNIPF